MLSTTGRWIEALARFIAMIGGLVLTAVAILTGISIIGRAALPIGGSPITGDFELVEAGVAFVVCTFMPWAQLKRSHASVTILTDQFPLRVNLVIDLVSDALLTLAAFVITWRLYFGLLDKKAYAETTFILQYPLWWGYAACMVGLSVWVVVGLWCTAADVKALVDNEPREADSGAVH